VNLLIQFTIKTTKKTKNIHIMAVTSENLTSFNNCVVWTCFGHFRILRSLTWMSGGRKPTSFYLCLF
jgi:hypothetical protein